MATLVSRNKIQQALFDIQKDPTTLATFMDTLETDLPEDLKAWLNKLLLLKGVPFNYLVPDEGMLPAESIRFFYLDMNWIDSLVDGAYSIGRNLTLEPTSASVNQDKVTLPNVQKSVKAQAHSLRSEALGTVTPPSQLQVVSGFLLRSSLVKSYPGMGVNAYPEGKAPGDGTIDMLNILRMEQLGPGSDTLLCLIDGDAHQIDIHEAPEALHYGIDKYSYADKPPKVVATKQIQTFTKSGSQVTLSDTTFPLSIGSAFRNTNAPRTVKMSVLAKLIAKQNKVVSVDAAQMGFEMTQGVGKVSFINKTT
jgi:hypothetical protein